MEINPVLLSIIIVSTLLFIGLIYLLVRYMSIRHLTKSLREDIGMPVQKKALSRFKNRRIARTLLKTYKKCKAKLDTVSSI